MKTPAELIEWLDVVARVSSPTITCERAAELAEVMRRQQCALEKINDIRNSIVGFQAFNWSMHAYPLVAALNEAGIVGLKYEAAREAASSLLDRGHDSGCEYNRELIAKVEGES